MKLIVGLGNPGNKYNKTKHNVGFDSVDKYIEKNNIKMSINKKFVAEVGKGNDVIVLKPLTYMNLSGDSIIKVINYYDINIEDLIVIYDDIDLEVGKIRIRCKGSSGGHNGIKSIINHLGTDFQRVKIGVGRKEGKDIIGDVLGKFSKSNRKIIENVLDITVDIFTDFVVGEDIIKIMSKYN